MKEHIITGGIVLGILYYLNQTYNYFQIELTNTLIIQLVIITIIYSLMPDIDQPGAIINKYVTLGLVGVALYSFYRPEYQQYGIISIAVLGLLRFIEHRTLIHSLLGALLISAPLLYLGKVQFIVGAIAFLVHIIADNDFSIGWEKDWRL